jgi:hypothetical protein
LRTLSHADDSHNALNPVFILSVWAALKIPLESWWFRWVWWGGFGKRENTTIRQQMPNGKYLGRKWNGFLDTFGISVSKSCYFGREMTEDTNSLWLSEKCRCRQTEKIVSISW